MYSNLTETASDLKVNEDFGVGYSPERINPGDKARSFDKITKVVSGSNSETLSAISKTYGAVIDAGIFETTSIKVAEAAKVIENTQRDLNIALINELSEIFERLDVETADVLEAAKTNGIFYLLSQDLLEGTALGLIPTIDIPRRSSWDWSQELFSRAAKPTMPFLRIVDACVKWAKEHKTGP